MASSKFNFGRNGRLIRRRAGVRLVAVSMLALAAACASPEQKVERYNREASEFLEQGDLVKAYIQYQNVLKHNEEHVPALLGLAEIAEERQDFQAMFGFLQRVARLDPSQVEAQIKLGKLYLISSDETTALEQAEKALALEPGNLDAQSLKAGVLLKIGDSAGAVELARAVLEKDPANAEAVTVIVTDQSVNGDFDAALTELNRALALNPQVAMLQLLRIHIFKIMGREKEAHDAHAELISLFPDQPAYRRVYANELVRNKDYAGAREQLEAVAELQPENLNAKLDVIRITRMASGGAAAQAKLESYIEANPEDTKLKFVLVDFHIGEGDKDKAQTVLETLVSQKNQDVALQAKNKLAAIYLSNKDYDAGKVLIEEILTADARNTDALIKRSALQIDGEEYDQAIVNLRSALDNKPDAFDAMVLMAAAFEKQDNFSFAQAELTKAYDASKRDASVANQFAKFLMRRKNIDRAEQVLADSIANHPGDLDNLRLLASIRLTKQDWRGAEEVADLLDNAGDEGALSARIKSAAYIGLEDFDGVIDTLSAQNEAAPLQRRPLSALVAAYIRQDRMDEAEALLGRILDTDEDNYTARMLLARVYTEQKDLEKLEKTLIDATESNPERAGAYELLYRSYIGQNRGEEAAALIERGLRAAPDSDALRVFKADILLQKNDREGALALYSDLIERRPDDRIIANNFVSLSSDLRQDEASIALALDVAKVLEAIENPYYQDTVGWAYYRAGEYSAALKFLKSAVEGAADNAEMLYHLGAAQVASGDKTAGAENLNKAISIGGASFPYANEARALLNRP